MKLGRITLLIPALVLALSGCIKEDTDGCIVDDNATLMFRYTVSGTDRFSEYVSGVDVFLFDGNEKFVMRKTLTKQMLADFQGVRLTVDPGAYYVVCWGNAGDRSAYSGFVPGATSFEDCFIRIAPASTESGDPVYYAPAKEKPASRSGAAADEKPLARAGDGYDPYRIEIPRGQAVTKTLEFVPAYRTVTVYTRQAEGSSHAPEVRIDHLWGCYNFFFETMELRGDFLQTARAEVFSGISYDVSRFYSALGKIMPDMGVSILRNPDGELLHSVNLEQFLDGNPSQDRDDIHIVVEFDALGIKVSVPDWKEQPVAPGN